MFTVAPELQKFFKGSENLKPDEVPASSRFQRQGQRILLSMHVTLELADKPEFEPFVREMLDKHKRFHIPCELYDVCKVL